MTVTEILEVMNEAFSIPSAVAWTESSVAVALKMCLRDLSNHDLLVKTTGGSDTITSSDLTIDVTESSLAQFKAVHTLTLTDSNSDPLQPLIRMEGNFEGYREEMALNDNRGTPLYYAISERLIYPYPAPNATFTYLLKYYANHLWAASGADITIEYTDDFLLCIAAGTAYFKGRLKNSFRKYIENWGPIYFEERQRMRGLV